jgi:hypothetical protein
MEDPCSLFQLLDRVDELIQLLLIEVAVYRVVGEIVSIHAGLFIEAAGQHDGQHGDTDAAGECERKAENIPHHFSPWLVWLFRRRCPAGGSMIIGN